MDEPRILTFDEMRNYGVILGRRQVDNLESQGKFPKRVPISQWRVGWLRTEIEAWVDEKVQARQTGFGGPASRVVGKGRDQR
jgi:prophage regulatory protein